MKHIQIDNYRVQEDLGVNILTSEACGLGMRLLCNLSSEAFNSYKSFIGMPDILPNKSFNQTWDDGSSIMLTRHSVIELLVYLLCEKYQTVIYVPYQNQNGYYVNECAYVTNDPVDPEYQDHLDRMNEFKWSYHIYEHSTHPGNGMRNLHHFSGKIE